MGAPDRDIVILLSSHNGESFLPAQLESLRAQTVADRIHVVIRDDGSRDSTVSMVESMDLAPLSVEIVAGTNLGARDSFTALICDTLPGFSTIMLCDQDDVWLPDKAEIAERAIAGSTVPVLYCGRSITTDAGLSPVGVTDDAPRSPCLHDALFTNIAPGHTMAFNPALADVYRRTINPHAIMHDWWLYLLAAGMGTVIFDPVPHAYYRLHASNEIGYGTTWASKLVRDMKRLVSEDRSSLTRQAEALWEAIGSDLSPNDRTMLESFLNQSTLASRWAYLRRYPMVAHNHRPPWTSTLLFLLGRYAPKPGQRPMVR